MTAIPLSALIQSDLVKYHQRLAEDCDEPADPRLLAARCIEAVADVRGGAVVILEGVIEAIEGGDLDLATLILREAAKQFRDQPRGPVN